jgi:hypothetical protein
MKRKNNFLSNTIYKVSNHTRSKTPIKYLYNPKRQKTTKIWISAIETRNYMLNDTLVDWLKIYKPKDKSEDKFLTQETNNDDISFKSHIVSKGIEFESKLIEYFRILCLQIETISTNITDKSILKTLELMKKGIPIIHSAPFKDNINHTRGVIDLLVRNDYIYKLTPDSVPIQNNYSKFGEYHYVVIDIKFSTLQLQSDGIHIVNNSKYAFYKTQTRIYTEAIGSMQNFMPRYSYIIGRRHKYTTNSVKYSNNSCCSKLGVIDFGNVDSSYIQICKKAKEWVRSVKQYGCQWSLNPPSVPELYPNMCVDSGLWNKEKKSIAEDLGDITSIWNCNIKHRKNAFKKNIRSWRDKRCKSINLGIKGKRAIIIDKIININRQSTHKILPKKINTNLYKWKTPVNEIYVDFETFINVFSSLDNLPTQENTEMIFMIGVYWKCNENWIYKSFICKKATYEEEYNIMHRFAMFCKSINYPKLWYWHAEKQFWNSAKDRQLKMCINKNRKYKNINKLWKLDKYWSDIVKILREEPVVIKDCFRYSLKHIAESMYKHGFITTKLESECVSGMSASVKAWIIYQEHKDPTKTKILKDIEKYNKFDVKVLWDILTYFRNNHT